jgi:hypothetical protein
MNEFIEAAKGCKIPLVRVYESEQFTAQLVDAVGDNRPEIAIAFAASVEEIRKFKPSGMVIIPRRKDRLNIIEIWV